MKKVAIYVRVSTARQDLEGYSIPLQKERLIAYSKAKGWVVAGVYVDPGHSGSSLDRPGMVELIKAVEGGKFDAVLVYKLDRLSRSQKDTLYLIEDIFMKHNTDFVSLQESFDTTTIYGRAMVGILSVFAQMERETIAERTLMGRAGRAEDGFWHGGGTDPIGYDYVNGELVINESEARQVQTVYSLYASGYSVTEISHRMEGCQTKHGDWEHTSTIGNVLDNPLYAGYVHFDGVKAQGRHPAIVDSDVDKRVKARRAQLRLLESSGDSNYLLTGVIFCASCGARYFAHRRPNGSVVYSCHSRAKKNRKMIKNPACKAPHIPISKLDSIVEAELLRLAADPSQVDELIKKRTADEGGSNDAAGKSVEVLKLDAEISRLMDLLQHDQLVTVGEIAERISQVHAARMELMPNVRETVPRQYDVESAKKLLYNMQLEWSGLDMRARRSFILQLVDGVHVGAEDIGVVWSFERGL